MASAREYDINLIQGVRVLPPGGSRSFIVALVTAALVAIAIVAVGDFGLHYYLTSLTGETDRLDADRLALRHQVDTFSATSSALSGLANQAVVADQLLQQVPQWTSMLNRLEHQTLVPIKISSLAADRSGGLRLTGESPSLATLMDQLSLWEHQPFLSNVKISGMTRDMSEQGGGQYRFVASLSLTPSFFYAK